MKPHDEAHELFGALRRSSERAAELAAARKRLDQEASVWLRLDRLIGTNGGRAFQEFAQSLNLQRLIDHANGHLRRLSQRYKLVQKLDKNDQPTLDFSVEDLWQVGSKRGLRSLSGGERFLVSLALALGLSDLRNRTLPVETLLLDEGFGTLDQETLEVALGALDQLQSDGRRVGIISHVAGLKERIQAQVRVENLGGGRSCLQMGRSAGRAWLSSSH